MTISTIASPKLFLGTINRWSMEKRLCYNIYLPIKALRSPELKKKKIYVVFIKSSFFFIFNTFLIIKYEASYIRIKKNSLSH